jgi:hypothetical protein
VIAPDLQQVCLKLRRSSEIRHTSWFSSERTADRAFHDILIALTARKIGAIVLQEIERTSTHTRATFNWKSRSIRCETQEDYSDRLERLKQLELLERLELFRSVNHLETLNIEPGTLNRPGAWNNWNHWNVWNDY